MATAQTTVVHTKKIEHLIKLGETFCLKAESGEWEVESGTYDAVLAAVNHTKAEICKQSRRRTMNIGTDVDHERRAHIAKENTRGRKNQKG